MIVFFTCIQMGYFTRFFIHNILFLLMCEALNVVHHKKKMFRNNMFSNTYIPTQHGIFSLVIYLLYV
jgi:hypothetical protein